MVKTKVSRMLSRVYMLQFPKSMRPIVTSSSEGDCLEFNYADAYGLSVHEKSLFDALVFKVVPSPYRDG